MTIDFPLVALKVETEAEGASWNYIRELKVLAVDQEIPLYLKIGGVEARTDMALAQELNIEGVIAPMVESPFGVKKFAESVSDFKFTWRALTIESMSSERDFSPIISMAVDSQISGVTLGRGDFADSINLRKQEDSDAVMLRVARMAIVAKEAGLIVTIGGNMKPTSIPTVLKFAESVDRLETRRCILELTNDPEQDMENLRRAIEFEISLEESRLAKASNEASTYQKRIIDLKQRIAAR